MSANTALSKTMSQKPNLIVPGRLMLCPPYLWKKEYMLKGSDVGLHVLYDRVFCFFYPLLSRSVSDHYLKLWICELLKATTNGDPAKAQTGDLSAQSPRLYHCPSPHIYPTIAILFLFSSLVFPRCLSEAPPYGVRIVYIYFELNVFKCAGEVLCTVCDTTYMYKA